MEEINPMEEEMEAVTPVPSVAKEEEATLHREEVILHNSQEEEVEAATLPSSQEEVVIQTQNRSPTRTTLCNPNCAVTST